MSDKFRRMLEILIILLVAGLSIAIFLYRDRLQNIHNVSYLGLCLLCFLANSTVLLPAPSLMIAASCALIMNPFLVAVFAALGSSLGEFVGYTFGTVSKDISPKLQRLIEKLESKIRNQTLMVFVFAALPLPLFDVVGIYSGGTRMNLLRFFLVCFAGKLLKILVYVNLYSIVDWTSFNISDWRNLI